MNEHKNLAVVGAGQHAFRLRCITLWVRKVHVLPVLGIVFFQCQRQETSPSGEQLYLTRHMQGRREVHNMAHTNVMYSKEVLFTFLQTSPSVSGPSNLVWMIQGIQEEHKYASCICTLNQG